MSISRIEGLACQRIVLSRAATQGMAHAPWVLDLHCATPGCRSVQDLPPSHDAYQHGSVSKRLLCLPVQSPQECTTRREERWHCPPRGEAAAHHAPSMPWQDARPCTCEAVRDSHLFVTLPERYRLPCRRGGSCQPHTVSAGRVAGPSTGGHGALDAHADHARQEGHASRPDVVPCSARVHHGRLQCPGPVAGFPAQRVWLRAPLDGCVSSVQYPYRCLVCPRRTPLVPMAESSRMCTTAHAQPVRSHRTVPPPALGSRSRDR